MKKPHSTIFFHINFATLDPGLIHKVYFHIHGKINNYCGKRKRQNKRKTYEMLEIDINEIRIKGVTMFRPHTER